MGRFFPQVGLGVFLALSLVCCFPSDGPSAPSGPQNSGAVSQGERDAHVRHVAVSPGNMTSKPHCDAKLRCTPIGVSGLEGSRYGLTAILKPVTAESRWFNVPRKLFVRASVKHLLPSL
jgi:hypothetical protein